MKKPIFAFVVLVRALLKLFRLELLTACWSREFHLSMTRSAKKNFLRSSRQRCLANFRLWPLVRLLLLITNNESNFRIDNPAYIVRHSRRPSSRLGRGTHYTPPCFPSARLRPFHLSAFRASLLTCLRSLPPPDTNSWLLHYTLCTPCQNIPATPLTCSSLTFDRWLTRCRRWWTLWEWSGSSRDITIETREWFLWWRWLPGSWLSEFTASLPSARSSSTTLFENLYLLQNGRNK